jgi:hypothetical protein
MDWSTVYCRQVLVRAIDDILKKLIGKHISVTSD